MTKPTSKDAGSSASVVGSRFSARWRILGWLLATTAIGLAAVIVTVTSALRAEVGREANADIVQELDEFNQFARDGVDPNTTQPFATAERLIEVFLRRQHASSDEIMIGFVQGASVVQVIRGDDLGRTGAYDPMSIPDLVDDFTTSSSGVFETAAGEFRWAKVSVMTTTGEQGSLIVGVYTEYGYAEVAATTQLMIWVSLGGLLLTALIGWVIAGQILRPIRVMRETAAEISQDDLTQRIPVHGQDDLAELATTFNDLLERLETAFTTEQRFVDDAGHELRTPITIIRGHLELLSDDPAERAVALGIVTQELDRMSRIVTDLLALAKSERPDFIQLGAPVDLADLTLDIDAKVQALAPRQWVLTHVAEGTAVIDAQRVTQAMLQLAQNAVQHTSDGEVIRIGSYFVLDTNGVPSVQFAVTDTGPGVTKADAEAIFERFARGTARRTSGQRSGAGLGLAIVRAIADGHQGSVYVDSVPGEGATFGLVLPGGTAETADAPYDANDETQEIDFPGDDLTDDLLRSDQR